MTTRSGKMIVGAAAFAFAAALLVPSLAAAQEAKAAPPAAYERPGRMLAREALDLTPDQEKALAEFRKARTGERRAYRDEMSGTREEMRGLAADPEANRAKIEALIDRASRLRAEHEKAAFRHRADRDKIFTPDQREKMKAFRESLATRRGFAGRGTLGIGRPGFRGPGRLMGQGFERDGRARARMLRDRPGLRWRRW
jgi:Spy/CpxP family protein refolding chaperone